MSASGVSVDPVGSTYDEGRGRHELGEAEVSLRDT